MAFEAAIVEDQEVVEASEGVIVEDQEAGVASEVVKEAHSEVTEEIEGASGVDSEEMTEETSEEQTEVSGVPWAEEEEDLVTRADQSQTPSRRNCRMVFPF